MQDQFTVSARGGGGGVILFLNILTSHLAVDFLCATSSPQKNYTVSAPLTAVNNSEQLPPNLIRSESKDKPSVYVYIN